VQVKGAAPKHAAHSPKARCAGLSDHRTLGSLFDSWGQFGGHYLLEYPLNPIKRGLFEKYPCLQFCLHVQSDRFSPIIFIAFAG